MDVVIKKVTASTALLFRNASIIMFINIIYVLMDFEGFLQKKKKPYKKNNLHNYHQKNRFNYNYSKDHSNFNPAAFIKALQPYKKLKFFLIIFLIIVVVVIIGLIFLLFPLVASTINYISQNGISGLLNEVINFLNKLWNGTK